MRILRVSRRTMDNYIKAGKLTPTRINKQNYFTINKVKWLLFLPSTLAIRTLREDVQIMIRQLAQMQEAGEEW